MCMFLVAELITKTPKIEFLAFFICAIDVEGCTFLLYIYNEPISCQVFKLIFFDTLFVLMSNEDIQLFFKKMSVSEFMDLFPDVILN